MSEIVGAPELTTGQPEARDLTPYAGLIMSSQFLDATQPEVNANELGAFEDYSTGMSDFSTLYAVGAGAVDVYQSNQVDSNAVDYDYVVDKEKFLSEDKESMTRLNEIKELAETDAGAFELLRRFNETGNSARGAYVLKSWDDYKEIQNKAQNAGGVAYWAGAATSLLGENGLLAMVALGSGGVTAPVIARNIQLAGAQIGARMTAAGRVAAVASVDAAFDSWGRDRIDASFSEEQYWAALGAAGFIGGSLGAAAPKLVGNVWTKKQWETEQASRMSMLKEGSDEISGVGTPRSGGAAAVVDEFREVDEVVPAAGFGTVRGVRQVVDNPLIRPFRSPKERAKDLIQDASNARTTHGLTVPGLVASLTSRLTKLTAFTQSEVALKGTTQTVEEGMKMRRARLADNEHKIDKMWKAFSKAQGVGAGKRMWREYAASSDSAPDLDTIRRHADLKSQATADNARITSKIATLQGKLSSVGEAGPAKPKVTGAAKATVEKALGFALAKAQRTSSALTDIDGMVESIAMKSGFDTTSTKELVDSIGALDNSMYRGYGEEEVAAGLLKADVEDGYRPQVINTELAKREQGEVKRLIASLLRDEEPDMTSAWSQRIMTEMAEVGEDGTPNVKTWDDFWDMASERPDIANRMMDEWQEAAIDAEVKRYDGLMNDIEFEYKSGIERAGADLLTYRQSVVDKIQKSLTHHQAKLDKLLEAQAGAGGAGTPKTLKRADNIAKVRTSIEKANLRLKLAEQRLERISSMTKNQQELEGFLKGAGRGETRGSEFRIKEAWRLKESKIDKALLAQTKATARAAYKDRADGIFDALVNNDTMDAFAAEDILATSRHFKRRTLDLSGVRHRDEWRRYYTRSPSDSSRQYTTSVGVQLELEAKFGSHLRSLNAMDDADKNIPRALLKYVTKLHADETADMPIGSPQRIAAQNLHDQQLQLLKDMLMVHTRSDIVEMYRAGGGKGATTQTGLNVASAIGTASMLSKSGLMVPVDIATAIANGGSFGLGFIGILKGIMNPRKLGRLTRDMEEIDSLQAIAVQGEHMVMNTSFAKHAETDEALPVNRVPGALSGKMETGSRNVATASQMASGLIPLSKALRHMVGKDVSNHLVDVIMDPSKASNSVLRELAHHGLGTAELQAMRSLVKSSVHGEGRHKFADTTSWSGKSVDYKGNSVSGDYLREKFLSAHQNLSDRLFAEPSIGDSPFWTRRPAGRVIMMFTRFMYTLQERFVGPMVQEAMLDGVQARHLGAVMFGLGASYMALAAKGFASGKDTPETRLLMGEDKDGDMWLAMQRSFRRSPLMVGVSDTFFEALATSGVAKSANDAIGANVFDPQPLKYQSGGEMWGVLGPLAGLGNRAYKTVAGATERPIADTAERTWRMTPLANAAILQMAVDYYNRNN